MTLHHARSVSTCSFHGHLPLHVKQLKDTGVVMQQVMALWLHDVLLSYHFRDRFGQTF